MENLLIQWLSFITTLLLCSLIIGLTNFSSLPLSILPTKHSLSVASCKKESCLMMVIEVIITIFFIIILVSMMIAKGRRIIETPIWNQGIKDRTTSCEKETKT